MALQDALIAVAHKSPQRIALLFQDEQWTYERLNNASDRMAYNLRALGLDEGDRVAILFTNRPEIVCAYYACFKAGLIAVPVNIRMKSAEMVYVLKHSGARVLLGEPELFRELEPVLGELSELEACFLTEQGHASTSHRDYSELLQEPEEKLISRGIDDKSPVLIVYTSGTTSRPKGVTHTHRSLSSLLISVLEVLGEEAMTVCAAVPSLAHIGSMGGAMLPAIFTGGTLLLIPKFEPLAVLEAFQRHHVTYFWMLPVMYSAISMVPDAARYLSSIRLCLNAGDVMPDVIRQRVSEVCGLNIRDICGMTEIIYSANPSDAPSHLSSIGLPLPGTDIRLLDAQGQEVLVGEVGEIVARGPSLMQGYWRDPEATSRVVKGGWMFTGDLARKSDDGYYWFIRRKKDILIRGGSNISPAEIEDVLHSHPDVVLAGVIGVPDDVWGEAVCAFVVLRGGTNLSVEALQEYVSGKVAHYKVPEQVRFVSQLPIGLTGKVHRQTLREWVRQ